MQVLKGLYFAAEVFVQWICHNAGALYCRLMAIFHVDAVSFLFDVIFFIGNRSIWSRNRVTYSEESKLKKKKTVLCVKMKQLDVYCLVQIVQIRKKYQYQ